MPRPTIGGRPSVVRTLKRIRFLRGVPALDGDPQMNKNTINGAIGATFITNEGQKLLLDRELGDKLLDVRNIPSGAIYRIEHPETGDLVLPDTSWLENGLADGSLRLFSDATGKIAPERTLARVYDREYILKRDPYAEARLAVVLHLLKSGTAAHDPKLGAEIKKAWTADLQAKFGDQPDPATVRTWFGRVRDVTVTLSDMFSMSGRVPRANRLDPDVETVIDLARSRFWTNRGYKIVDVYAEVITELHKENLRRLQTGEPQLKLPGKETIRRRVNELFCRDTYAAKYGEQAARRKFDGSGKGISASRILQVGLMDDTVIDLVTVLDADRGLIAGRPYLNVLMDVHSRCILALTVSFQPPDTAKAAESLRIALNCVREGNRPKVGLRRDWQAKYPALATVNGKFAKIITDNGANYVAPGFTEMLLDLGIEHELAPVRSPRHKAIIERFFRSLNQFLIDKLPGATLDPSVLRKLGIDPSTEAVVTMSELQELLNHFVYLHHINHHSGIDAVPLQKWTTSMMAHGRDMILDNRLIDIVTGVTIHNKRVTAGGGVRLFGMTWKGAGLDAAINKLAASEPHRKRLDGTVAITTKVKYNPENLGELHVFVGDDWIKLENTQADYAEGLSLWHHQQVRAWKNRQGLAFTSVQERLAARHSLNLAIREAFPNMDARERRAAARLLGSQEPTKAAFEVEFAEAEPRHDGLGPIIEHEVPANEREDALRPVSRPSIGDKQDSSTGRDCADSSGDDPIFREEPIVEPAPFDDDDLEDEEYR